ncbi:M23 family metallopeptidase [Desulfofundulus thermobenzoicus]|uniref:M23 family metallopeptidase n=1 Tax=Desulfofundulus thermobenzoicus TaxID=29376 RepID=UPI0018844700|nr:M23 family metallopeptidase [Desulfofundulus thermobenzoicus]
MLWGKPRKKYPLYQRGGEDWYSRYPEYRIIRSPAGRRSWLWRLMMALAIFTVLVMVREAPYPAGEQVRENLRYILTTEWDFQPAVQKVVRLALQMVNVDHPFPGGDIPPDTRPVVAPPVPVDMQIPLSGKVVRGFGWSVDPLDNLERFHGGIDIAAPAGTPVQAARGGRVVKVAGDPVLGSYVLLDHGEGCYTLYGGLDRIQVTGGQQVASGQVLGRVGNKGDIPGGGLHFEMREKDKLIDPLSRLPGLGGR